MQGFLTTQTQNFYKEQIQKETLTRLTWKSRHARLYPSSYDIRNNGTDQTRLPQLPADTRAPKKKSNLPAPPPPPPPTTTVEGEQQHDMPPLMRPVSPQTRQTLYQDSLHHERGRSLYLRRRGHIRPEEKFDFPLLSSWEYGWRLGDYNLDYRTPSCARLSVVKSTFYARNGVFSSPSATDTVG